jgi:hypothetical protein
MEKKRTLQKIQRTSHFQENTTVEPNRTRKIRNQSAIYQPAQRNPAASRVLRQGLETIWS